MIRLCKVNTIEKFVPNFSSWRRVKVSTKLRPIYPKSLQKHERLEVVRADFSAAAGDEIRMSGPAKRTQLPRFVKEH